MIFPCREKAGEKLAQEMLKTKPIIDILLAIPRGGVLVGAPMARTLKVPLDVTVPRKIGAPRNPEFAIAALALDGTIVMHTRQKLEALPKGYLEQKKKETITEIKRRLLCYRGAEAEREVAGLRVCVVDDGVATGLTLLCAVQSLKKRKARGVFVAVPVGEKESYRRLSRFADTVLFLSTPEPFYAVGQFYQDFHQVSDTEVRTALTPS